MNTYTWIFTGLLVVDVILYIFGLIQRHRPLEKTARGLCIPFIAGIILSILYEFLPDSHHIILISSLAFSAASLFMVSTLNDKNRFVKFIEHFLFLLIEAFWFLLIASVYRIYKVPAIFFILAGIVFIAGFVVVCIFIKKQPVAKYLAAIIQYGASAIFCSTTLVSLIYEKRVFAILFFVGSLVTVCHVIFEIFQRTRPFAINEKTEKIFVTLFTVCAQALIGAGAILLQV
jgi:hypothetical protein